MCILGFGFCRYPFHGWGFGVQFFRPCKDAFSVYGDIRDFIPGSFPEDPGFPCLFQGKIQIREVGDCVSEEGKIKNNFLCWCVAGSVEVEGERVGVAVSPGKVRIVFRNGCFKDYGITALLLERALITGFSPHDTRHAFQLVAEDGSEDKRGESMKGDSFFKVNLEMVS